MMNLTPRKRVENILLKREADKVPFTIYEGLMPRCECERLLRNEGLCLICGTSVFSGHMPNVKERSEGFYENGDYKTRWFWETPCGTLTAINVPKATTSWREKRMFSTPDDYAAVAFILRDMVYTPNYESFIATEKEKGEDYLCRTGLGYEPLQELIYGTMGVETFCVEWMERRDEVLKLYQILVEQRRKIYKLVAESPCLSANYGGNVSPEIVGLERFRDYFVPNYQEAAEVLHKHGKLIGVHLDANNKLLAPEVAKTDLDYIEAFTPPPDCDLSVKDALAIWKDKVLWINFPSSVHIADEKVIERTTEQILREAAPGDRFIMGVTEDMPPWAYQKSMSAISRVINQKGKLPLR